MESCTMNKNACDWFGGIGGTVLQAKYLGISAETTDEQLDALVDVEAKRAKDEGVDVGEGTMQHFNMLREVAQRDYFQKYGCRWE